MPKVRITWNLMTKKFVLSRDQLGQIIKIYILLFPKCLFFQLNFGAKMFEIGHCVLEIWHFNWGCHNRLVKLFEKKALQIWESVQNIGILATEMSIFTWKYSFVPNPSSELKNKGDPTSFFRVFHYFRVQFFRRYFLLLSLSWLCVFGRKKSLMRRFPAN